MAGEESLAQASKAAASAKVAVEAAKKAEQSMHGAQAATTEAREIQRKMDEALLAWERRPSAANAQALVVSRATSATAKPFDPQHLSNNIDTRGRLADFL
eukprot:COSAG02_NODE_6176_length_3735_cov_7.536565_2_plen_100_part_00